MGWDIVKFEGFGYESSCILIIASGLTFTVSILFWIFSLPIEPTIRWAQKNMKTCINKK